MNNAFKIGVLLIRSLFLLAMAIAIAMAIRTIFTSKKAQFFEACNRSNQAMLFVYGKNQDKSSPCGKCWDAFQERLSRRMDVRMLAIGRSCSNVTDGCEGSEGTMSCDCVA